MIEDSMLDKDAWKADMTLDSTRICKTSSFKFIGKEYIASSSQRRQHCERALVV